jgi:hypothetical protein
MPSVKVNTNRVEISFTKDYTYQAVGIGPLLSSPKVVGVLLEEVNGDGIVNNVAMGKAFIDGTGFEQDNELNFSAYGTHIVGFHHVLGQWLRLRGRPNARIYIRAELFANEFVFRSIAGLASLEKTFSDGDVNQWIDKTVTPLGDDTIADISGVIITRSTSDPTDWGARTKGSTDDFQEAGDFGAAGTEVVGVDSNGQYQLYAGGKDGDPDVALVRYWETGYILQDGMRYITNPVSEGFVNTNDVYIPLDLSGTVPTGPAGATHAFVRFQALAGIHLGHCRPTGSTDPVTDMRLSTNARVTNIIPLTDEGLAEYATDAIGPSPYVTSYIQRIPTAYVNIKGSNVNIKGGTMHIGRG